jgi:hypothetical protein
LEDLSYLDSADHNQGDDRMNRIRITKICRLLLTLVVVTLGFPTLLMTVSAAEPGDPDTSVKITDVSFDCGQTGTSQILVSIANDPGEPRLVHGVEVHLSFDPTKLQVVDADPVEPGVQIAPDGGLFPLDDQVVVQEVDNAGGTIVFAVSHGVGVQDATDAAIAIITWESAVDCATMTEEACLEVSVVYALMSDPSGYAIYVDGRLPGTVCISTGGYITGSVEITDASFGCGQTDTSQVLISIVNDPGEPQPLYGVEVHLSFDPTKLQVVDADGDPANGVQIVAEDGLFPLDEQVVVQEVNNAAGTILFAVSQLDGDGVQEADGAPIATITWESAFDCVTMTEPEICSMVDVTEGTLMSDSNGRAIDVDDTLSGTVCVLAPLDGCVAGSVQLQGRDGHSGVTVTAGGVSLPVAPDGSFEVCGLTSGTYEVQAEMYSYLDSRAFGVVVVAGETTDINSTKLLGGDIAPQPETDNVIDIGDVTYIASRFLGGDMTSDVNGDGVVNIFDLTIAAANFGRTGPTPWSTTP